MQMKTKEGSKGVRKYRLDRKAKFTIEPVRAIEAIFNAYLLVLSSELSLQLRSSVKVSIDKMYELTYGEFVDSLDKVTMLGIYDFLPLEKPFFIQIDSMFGFLVIDNLCGGGISYSQREREITNLDKKLIQYFFINLLEKFEVHWDGVIPGAKVNFNSLETSSLFYHTVSEGDAIYVVDVAVNFQGEKYIIKYIFPYSSIGDKILEFISKRNSDEPNLELNEENVESLKDSLYSSNVELEVELGKVHMSFKELSNIAEGDIILLDKKNNSPLDLRVQGVPLFKVRSGVVNKRFAVEVLSKIDKDVMMNE